LLKAHKAQSFQTLGKHPFDPVILSKKYFPVGADDGRANPAALTASGYSFLFLRLFAAPSICG
jgi:hypothetical protein